MWSLHGMLLVAIFCTHKLLLLILIVWIPKQLFFCYTLKVFTAWLKIKGIVTQEIIAFWGYNIGIVGKIWESYARICHFYSWLCLFSMFKYKNSYASGRKSTHWAPFKSVSEYDLGVFQICIHRQFGRPSKLYLFSSQITNIRFKHRKQP